MNECDREIEGLKDRSIDRTIASITLYYTTAVLRCPNHRKEPRGPPVPEMRISAKFLNIALRLHYCSHHAGSHCKMFKGSYSTGIPFRDKRSDTEGGSKRGREIFNKNSQNRKREKANREEDYEKWYIERKGKSFEMEIRAKDRKIDIEGERERE